MGAVPRGGARGSGGMFNGCSCGYNDKRREYVETTGSMYNNDDSLFTTRMEAKPTPAGSLTFPTFCSLLVILRVLTGSPLARSVLVPAFLTQEIIE